MSCLIFDSGSDVQQQQLFKRLFPDENIDHTVDPPVWLISNKYYKAKVKLHVFKKSSDAFEVMPTSPMSGSHRIGASVFFAGTFNEAESMKLVDLWRNFVASKLDGSEVDDGPEVQLVVVERFASEAVKNEALEWALEHGVEVVDFSDDDDKDDDDDEGGVTCFASSGPKRVIEALQTCLWNSLEETPSGSSEAGRPLDPEVTAAEMEDFETLFAQLSTFKSAGEGLPDDERKAFAEKIALAFYKSLGGDSESDSDTPPDN